MPVKNSRVKSSLSHREAKSAVVAIGTRQIKPLMRLLLFVRAGGQCEFDGCLRDLLRHHVTLTDGNFAQVAHIVAFRKRGPRGDDSLRPADINDLANLMLLCAQCHKLIDDHPEKYSRRTLAEYKVQHERRIRYVTSLGPDRKTTVLILKSRIGSQSVQVPIAQVIEATAPLYPTSAEPNEIDLSPIDDRNPGFMEAASEEIRQRINTLFESGGPGNKAQHLSIFALAPIPLLISLGRQLSNKVPSELYQRHRDTESWTWNKRGTPVEYVVRKRSAGTAPGVGLILPLSGSIPSGSVPDSIRRGSTLYEISLLRRTPSTTFLRLRQDLERFRLAYQEVLGEILRNHGLVESIDLFPAVPAPIAILCGRELLPKVHPRLRVYDYDRASNGFTFKLEV